MGYFKGFFGRIGWKLIVILETIFWVWLSCCLFFITIPVVIYDYFKSFETDEEKKERWKNG